MPGALRQSIRAAVSKGLQALKTPEPLNLNQWLQNIANLLYDPRPPVFITNLQVANSNDFRYFLDLVLARKT